MDTCRFFVTARACDVSFHPGDIASSCMIGSPFAFDGEMAMSRGSPGNIACQSARLTPSHRNLHRNLNTESDDDIQPKVVETIGKLPNVDIWALHEFADEEALANYGSAAKGAKNQP